MSDDQELEYPLQFFAFRLKNLLFGWKIST